MPLNALIPVAMLVISNVFMTFAWYGNFKVDNKPMWLIIVVSWGIAFFEYCIAVPANRMGRAWFSTAELKTIQEVVTLTVFIIFSVTFLGEKVTVNQIVGFALIAAGAFVVSKGPFGA
jgi:uncharacterized protein